MLNKGLSTQAMGTWVGTTEIVMGQAVVKGYKAKCVLDMKRFYNS